MTRRKKMTAEEMERWLINQGAIPITEEMKKEPWYAEASKLPPCMVQKRKRLVDLQKGISKTLK